MNILPTSLALVACLLTVPTVFQGGREAPATPKAAPARTPEIEDLIGAWRLTDFESISLKQENRQQVGYLLINDEFLSFECHIGWFDDPSGRSARMFFSGTHRYKLRQGGVLDMSQLIGSTIDPNSSSPIFEQVGRRRQYRVTVNGAKLVLTRDEDPQTFTFEKMVSSGAQLDFYGRLKRPKDGDKE